MTRILSKVTDQLASEGTASLEALQLDKKAVADYIFKRPLFNFKGEEFGCYFVIGQKRMGKTVWLEWAAEKYKKAGYLIIDCFDSGDFEGAYWGIRDCKFCHGAVRYDQRVCPKCKITPKPAYKVLLVVPEYVECTINDPNFILINVEEGLKKIVEKALKEDLVISLASGAFNTDHLFKTLAEWTYQWQQLNRDYFQVDACFIMREAADVAFARGKGLSRKYQPYLKSGMINLIRKAGHCQTIILFDSQRFMGLDIGVRGNIPYIILKKHSSHDQPLVVKNLNDEIKAIRWQWWEDEVPPELINKRRPEVTWLRKYEFYVLFDDGEYEVLSNAFPSFHHKGPRDYFQKLTGLKYKQELYTIDDGKDFKSIKDIPKSALLKLNYQLSNKFGLTDKDRATLLGRKASTLKDWINDYKNKV